MKKDVVAGLGEIGLPIFKVFSKIYPTFGYDIDKNLMPNNPKKIESYSVRFLHICIPFNKFFLPNTLKLNKKFVPDCIVIHSTVKPETTKKLQKRINIPVIYSPTRGVHKRMIHDLKRYTKFFALDDSMKNSLSCSRNYANLLKKSGIKSNKISNSVTLELSKIICDTSYYGWLINYAQMSKMIADKYAVDYDEMWTFSDEIHKFLGNRPKMFPGFIGGHCVIPNLELINENSLNSINQINNMFKKFLKKS
tara:strand:+ start:2730 stop:3482 length:753 start_codon:yes stop_codon:yes gene_type:complete